MRLEVVTPLGPVVSADVEEVTVPGEEGEFGVLPGHTAFLTILRAGVLAYRAGGKRSVVAVGDGFAEVTGDDKILVLTQTAKVAEKIDAAAAQREFDETDKAYNAADDKDAAAKKLILRRRDFARASLDALKPAA